LGLAGVAASGLVLAGVAASGLGLAGVAASGLGLAGVAASGLGLAGVAASALGLAGVAASALGLAGVAGAVAAFALVGVAATVGFGISNTQTPKRTQPNRTSTKQQQQHEQRRQQRKRRNERTTTNHVSRSRSSCGKVFGGLRCFSPSCHIIALAIIDRSMATPGTSKALAKLEKSVADGNYYEALQLYKGVARRYGPARRHLSVHRLCVCG